MRTPTTEEIRRAFINSSRSKAASVTFPASWSPPADDLDFLGWIDPKAPRRAYLVISPPVLGEVVAVELRMPSSPPRRSRKTMCDLCQSAEAPDGSALMVAPRAGSRGRSGDSVGLYVCTDFGCSLRARQPLKSHERSVSGRPDTRVPDLVDRLLAFVERIQA
jgi:hypothetical protein